MKKLKKIIALVLTLALCITSPVYSEGYKTTEVKAEQLGTLADKVTGTWSYWDGNKDVVQTNAMLLDKLPTLANKGTYRFTTDNYDANIGPLQVGGWSTSMAWNYSSNEFGNATYAIPLSYVAKSTGMYMVKPSTKIHEDVRPEANTQTLFMNQPEDGSLTDLVIGAGYTFASSKVDKVDEWSTDVVMENASNPSQYMKTTMVQGSPFGYFQVYGGTTMTVQRIRSLPSDVCFYNGSTLSNSTMLIIRCFDNLDLVSGYTDYDYYALYVPEGTVWTQTDATAKYADNRMGDLTASFPSGDKAYMSVAWLCETNGVNDQPAQTIAQEYEKYAYNFVTDTKTSFEYDRYTGKIVTTYEYSIDKKVADKADGTVMGIPPHQYKNMSGYTYMDQTARTIRGTMKFLVGSSYKTELKYSGILHAMPSVEDADIPQLQSYVDDFMDEYGPTDTAVTKESYGENTYDCGKKMNRAIQVMEAAEACGDTQTANALLEGLKAELADWFTATGEEDDKYFYYYEPIGSIFGFPQAYYTVDGMTDHHFHYGYFIQAAAQVALRDPSFIDQYGDLVNELVGDIATYEETTKDSKYPFLRYFSTYEGHSWASGHANFGDGNDQESSSEALNAWSALILWGQATGDEELTDLGIYLYQTEISSVMNYWFDVDGDVLDKKFTKTSSADSSLPEYAYASLVWGGKYTYATWWTAEPLQIQGINILPMTASSLYLAADTDFILKNWKTANLKEAGFTGGDKNTKRWNELWSAYLAIADTEKALEYFDDTCDPEAGDSKAHAYHYIMSLDKAGTPNLDISCNLPLATTFVNKDGDITYVAYNAGDTEVVAQFSDGSTLTVPAKTMISSADSGMANKATYTVKHYIENADGSYTLFQTETKSGKVGVQITAKAKSFEGYALNESAPGSVLSGEISDTNPLELVLYYDLTEIETTVPTQNTDDYTFLGQYNGCSIMYKILKDDFGIANIQLLEGNRTFYVVYAGTYNATNTTGYKNGQPAQSNILQGVYNLQLTTVEPNSWNTIKAVSGDKQIYIVIKFGEPTGAPDLSDYEGEIETPDPNLPTDAMGLSVGCPSDNTMLLTFRESEEQNSKGQLYNIYIDGVLVENGVDVGTYTYENISRGRHTVKVTALLGNVESEGVESTVNVTGETFTTEPVETTTKEEVPTDVPTDATTDAPTQAPTVEPTDVPTVEPTDAPTDAPTVEPTDIPTDAPTNAPTTEAPSVEEPTIVAPETTVAPTTKAPETTTAKIKLGRTKVKKATKKLKFKKISIKLKKVKGVKKYQIQISKKMKFTKKNILVKKTVKKIKINIKSKKIRNKKKLWVRARAMKVVKGKKYYGKWSKKKKVKVRK